MMIPRLRSLVARRRAAGSSDEIQNLRKTLERRELISAKLVAFAPYLRTLLVIAGLLYTLALPHQLLGRGHYIDENALQPGQVNTYWNWADVHVADRYADSAANWNELPFDRRTRSVKDAFQDLGLPTAVQNYRFDVSPTSNVSGSNVYAVLAAPKTDGAEAIVLSASWLSRAREHDGTQRMNIRGVSLLLAIANYFKKYSMWSKDIIFVISDGYSDGMQAWLDAYHGAGQANLHADPLPLTTGPIWAAVNLDYPHHSFSHIGLYFEGANGRLPNLDLVNSASKILHHTGIPPLLHSYDPKSELPAVGRFAASLPEVARKEVETYWHSAANLFRQVALGADGRVLGPEGSFGRYRIDAITLFGVPAEGPHGFHALGRATESLVRSINNLLERLHASGFLYLMTSVETFISASNYLAAPILIGAGLTIDGLLTWSQAGRNPKGQARDRPVLLAVVLLGAVVGVGASQVAIVSRVDPMRKLPEYLSAGLLSVHLFTPLVVVNLLMSRLVKPASAARLPFSVAALSRTVRAMLLLASGLLISISATLNFGLSLVSAIYLASVLFLLAPLHRRYHLRKTLPRRIQQFALALASPVGLWTMWRIANRTAAERWLSDLLRDWHVGGGWSLPVALGLVGPLVILQAVSVQL